MAVDLDLWTCGLLTETETVTVRLVGGWGPGRGSKFIIIRESHHITHQKSAVGRLKIFPFMIPRVRLEGAITVDRFGCKIYVALFESYVITITYN